MKFIHYVKVALRNMLRYKQQTAISVMGLAIGLVCFALSLFWIQYESRYDSFQPECDRIFRVVRADSTEEHGFSTVVSSLLAKYLQQTVPEVAAASNFKSNKRSSGDETYWQIAVDSSFFKLLQVTPLLGNCENIFKDPNHIILSRSRAMKTFGRVDVVGETFGENYRVCAVVEDWPIHTNFPLEVILFEDVELSERLWHSLSSDAYIRLKPEVSVGEACKKIESMLFSKEQGEDMKIKLIPLSELHYSGINSEVSIKYSHIQIFAAMGALVIICTLINFIVLYISRLRMRGKELVLRKVSGASNGDLMLQLILEIVLIMLIASLLGCVGVEWILPIFKELACIEMESSDLLLQITGYFLAITTILSLVAYLPISYYRKQVFMHHLHATQSVANKYLFRRISLMTQLIITISFIFCITIFVRQIYHLTHSHLGFERKNIFTLVYGESYRQDGGILPISELQSITAIEKFTSGTPFLPTTGYSCQDVSSKPEGDNKTSVLVMKIFPNYLDVLGIEMAQGQVSDIKDDNSYLVNETAARYFKLDMNENKHFYIDGDRMCTVVGIVRDFYLESPLLPIRPIIFRLKEHEPNALRLNNIIYKCADGKAREAREALKALYKKHGAEQSLWIISMEMEYDAFFRSEKVLLVLLSILSFICVIISLFGVYSMVSLTNEQRRKEMAVRKANGASVRTILSLFLKEYLVVTAVASLFAFLIGYLIMQSWLELYSNRTDIGFWVYPIIFAIVALAVVLTVLGRVWKTAHINPAQELKKE